MQLDTAGSILGILVALLVLVLWLVIAGAIPVAFGGLVHLAAILAALITGGLVAVEVSRP